jgi:hypothetical protein
MTDEIKNHYGRPLPPLLPEKIDGLSESMNAFLHATSEKLHVDEALPSRVCNSADPRTEQEKAVTGAAPTKDPKWHATLETPKGKFYSTDGNWYETFDEALRNDYDATEKKLQQQQAWAAQEKAERADEAAREQLALAKEIAALHQPPYGAEYDC